MDHRRAHVPNHRDIKVLETEHVQLDVQNATTMFHPMHLHGHTFQVGPSAAGPRKDTINVLPGQTVSLRVVCDNPGQWMFHCHNTYHLETGMATVVSYVR